jgi:hypothetical protein
MQGVNWPNRDVVAFRPAVHGRKVHTVNGLRSQWGPHSGKEVIESSNGGLLISFGEFGALAGQNEIQYRTSKRAVEEWMVKLVLIVE